MRKYVCVLLYSWKKCITILLFPPSIWSDKWSNRILTWEVARAFKNYFGNTGSLYYLLVFQVLLLVSREQYFSLCTEVLKARRLSSNWLDTFYIFSFILYWHVYSIIYIGNSFCYFSMCMFLEIFYNLFDKWRYEIVEKIAYVCKSFSNEHLSNANLCFTFHI